MRAQLVRRAEWYSDVPRSVRGHKIFGYSVLAFSLFGFGYWSDSAPIAGAVVASGVFVATGQNKIVQHLEGGVIKAILVKEGDRVEQGQPLLLLDDTTARAELERLTLRYARAAAIDARLQAEAHEKDKVEFADDLIVDASRDVATIVESQRLTFEAKRRSQRTEVAALNEGMKAFQQRIEGTRQQLAGVTRQLDLVNQELEGKIYLMDHGMMRKSDVLALERGKANLEGEAGRLKGEIGDSQEQIARVQEQIELVRYSAIKTAVEQLHENKAEVNDLRERIIAARRVLDRVTIAAPVSGIVVKMRYHTPGGVVEPGKNILEIVPTDDDLIIEVRVRPQDIESVRRGQPATVRLSALNRRITPTLDGDVVYISADAVPEDRPGQPGGDAYVARIRLDADQHAKVPEFVPTPGMPAEVYIKTHERTFLGYILKPLKDSLSRAFRES